MTTPDITQEDLERARELRRELRPVLRWSDHADTCDCCQAADDIIAAALAAARAEGERKGIKRAAARIDDFDPCLAGHIRALIPQEPGTAAAINSADYQQQQGAVWDIIDEAIAAYDGWMLDDDYDANRVLKEIVERMRARKQLHLHQEPGSNG